MTKTRNRLIAVGIALLLIIAAAVFIFPAKSANAEDAWDGITTTAFTGSGTQADPYVISSGAQLAFLAERINSGAEGYTYKNYKLTADIDLGNQPWTPIGTKSYPFTGTFDGDGHIIKNLTSTSGKDGYAGLFGANSGTIKNVYLDTVNISTTGGYAAALCVVNNADATIEGCAVLSGNVEAS